MAASDKQVVHVVARSRGGIRRHVRYLAGHPPPGYATLGVRASPGLRSYFEPSPVTHAGFVRRLAWPAAADLVHAHGFEAGAVALRKRRGPVVLTVHTDLRTQGRTAGSRPVRALARLIADRSDAVIAVSAGAARHFPQARVIPPAVETLGPPNLSREEVRGSLGTPPGRVVVVAVARLHPDKGLASFIDAVARTGAEGWICGDGPMRADLERRAEGTSVRLLGYREDVADVLGAADVFALPSVGEAYGIAVSEAIAAGLPVVVSAAGAMPELAGDAALVVPPGDARAFAEAVERLVADVDLRRELAEHARKASPPDPHQLVARVGAVYDEVLG